jgi:formylmethanofuran dehydrogenase subunit A
MLKIINGSVYDPAQGFNGQIGTVCVGDDGKICEPSLDTRPCEIVDAAGCAVMAGGVDIHSHIAGTKVNSARSMCPEDHYDHFKPHTATTRAGTGFTVPTSFYTGYEYAGLGYTTVFEAAVPPLEARHAHEELLDVPIIDTGTYTLMGNNYMVMQILAEHDPAARRERLRDLVSWLLASTKGYAVKVVNPGGVESWKWAQGIQDLDTPVPPFGVTPRRIMMGLAETIRDLGLPHGMHLHCNHLGEAGNYITTLETMKTLDGLPFHLTHLQFHAYNRNKKGSLKSAAQELADYINEHPNVTCDVGQMVFGPATTMTADAPMQYRLHVVTGHKWINNDVEMESGAGVVPLYYKPTSLVNAIQWCVGLELLLLIKNAWQIILTTDHPNAGQFSAYPQIIRLLMDRDYRAGQMEALHPRVGKYTVLSQLPREYTLEEIAIVTRSAAAKTLGLPQRGNLCAGSHGDIAVYRLQEDKQRMFGEPVYVFKDGVLVVRDGKAVQSPQGSRLLVGLDRDAALPDDLAQEFHSCYSVTLANFPVQEEYVPKPEVIACKETV